MNVNMNALPGSPARTPYRKAEEEKFLSKGFTAFRLVPSLTPFRGSITPYRIPEEERQKYIVICRPATSGRYGKSVSHRAIPVEEL